MPPPTRSLHSLPSAHPRSPSAVPVPLTTAPLAAAAIAAPIAAIAAIAAITAIATGAGAALAAVPRVVLPAPVLEDGVEAYDPRAVRLGARVGRVPAV